jgi:CheY-like chemotaxis protein
MNTSTTILIVEDDAFKLQRISQCLERLPDNPQMTIVTSVQAAVALLAKNQYDIILLDMALPSHDIRSGGAPASSLLSGGLEIIMELAFLRRQERVVIITQYPEIEIEGNLVSVDQAHAALRQLCDVNLAAVIHYKHEEASWEAALLKAVN